MTNGVSQMDIVENRSVDKYALGVQARRCAWALFLPVFRFSPRLCFAFRTRVLRLLGAKVGAKVNVYGTAVLYFPWNAAF